jgi:hypothetical protein
MIGPHLAERALNAGKGPFCSCDDLSHISNQAGFMGKNVFYSKRVDVVTKAKTF